MFLKDIKPGQILNTPYGNDCTKWARCSEIGDYLEFACTYNEPRQFINKYWSKISQDWTRDLGIKLSEIVDDCWFDVTDTEVELIKLMDS